MTYPGAVEVSTGTFVEHTVIGYTEHVKGKGKGAYSSS